VAAFRLQFLQRRFKGPYVRLCPKLVLQSLSPPPQSRLPERLQDPVHFFDTFVAEVVVTRAELATRILTL